MPVMSGHAGNYSLQPKKVNIMFLDNLNPHKANWKFHESLDTDSREKIETAIESLVPESTEIVAKINKRIKTTQYNYGDYMSALHTLVPDNNPLMLYVTASALKRAGADTRGLVSALNIVMGR